MSVEISIAAQPFKKSHLKRLQWVNEMTSKDIQVVRNGVIFSRTLVCDLAKLSL